MLIPISKMKIVKTPLLLPRPRVHNGEASMGGNMAAPPGQFITLQTFNALKETILGYGLNSGTTKCNAFSSFPVLPNSCDQWSIKTCIGNSCK